MELINLLEIRIKTTNFFKSPNHRFDDPFNFIIDGTTGENIKDPQEALVKETFKHYLNFLLDAKTYLAEISYEVKEKLTQEKIKTEQSYKRQFGIYKSLNTLISHTAIPANALFRS